VETAFLTGLGLAAPAGLNAYLPLLIVALAHRFTGGIVLDSPYDLISTNWGIALLLLLLTVELVVDKVPGVDHLNDLINSAIRPPAGAALMMASTSDTDLNPVIALVIGLVIAGAVHAVKAATRPAITVTTGGMGNALVSFGEDMLAATTAIIAIAAPVLVVVALTVLAALLFWSSRRLSLSRPTNAPPRH
jgi:hypothetical protein